ncbi:MAG: PTS sugar transporter subunit IIA [Hespellia sp.]|jgi:PTS system galactitol-specific IIA component|nr:PTS sugar transporter subunit IIA [Hespellia sp.]
MEDVLISPELVLMEIAADSDQEALEILARHLYEKNVVKESYVEAVKSRERAYSTGLEFAEMGIAIPHTDAKHVCKQAIAIGFLKDPVSFCHMGMPEVSVKTEILFMMAIKNPGDQVGFLEKMMDLFQTEGFLTALKACTTEKDVAEMFQKCLVSES